MTPEMYRFLGITRSRSSRPLVRFALALRAKLSWQRIGFTALICALVSTQVLFQPSLYRPFLLDLIMQSWLDYLGECVLMGMTIMLVVTVAQVLTIRLPRIVVFSALAAALVAGAIAGALLVIPYYDLPLDSAFDSRFLGDVAYWLLIATAVALIYTFQQRATAAAESLHRAQVEQIAFSKEVLEAHLQVMRAQIEPHFLFNTLANVKRLSETDVSGGMTMLDNLVRYLRTALPRMREEQTTLGQEADLVQAYLAVLQIRMGNRLRYLIEIPEELREQKFPPLMLLTLAENAIKHGINPSPHGGTIAIRAEMRDRSLLVRVADSGLGFGVAATGGAGVGLANTRARLAALYGEAAGLDLAANEPSGVTATIRMPRMQQADSVLTVAVKRGG